MQTSRRGTDFVAARPPINNEFEEAKTCVSTVVTRSAMENSNQSTTPSFEMIEVRSTGRERL
jgi:hypothetical protein